ncbi:membrane protease subunit (stomatin/prohibitin family) [Cereibacter ovatus]|uniref:Membrane protease subunit (Stomatin/prohibitin family) n=1 Tax=Cereibacter ovatus TaxID=439529 RepID=A0A285CIN9_9RHOB|nr:SPFH domain-containing protein [Cereibacter ovatus]SNX67471.1 membrane protease subunit (stomatin/prohibitin family) [Cereibacter ovatus]
MPIFDFLGGEFIDVIHWVDDTRDTMVWRFERHGHAIKYGAKLTVREGQSAVFIHEGQLADVFGPGLYMLETNNLPVLTTLQHWDHGFRSPFKSEVYFVATTRFNDLKWGTKNPIICRDAEFGPVRLRAFGTYSMRVTDPGRFMTEIVGTDGEFTSDEISFQIRNVIVQEMTRVLAGSGIPVLDMAANTADLGRMVAEAIAPTVAAYGLAIPELYIENISLPEEVEKALDKRTSMGIVGDLHRYTQFSAAEALAAPEGAAGSGLAAGMGAAMGLGMAQRMQGPWGAAPAAAPPPPPPLPPAGVAWHVAANGAPEGPLTEADLARRVAAGQLRRDTLVWSAGMAGWTPASEVPALAALFAPLPPPLPPGA